MGVFNQEQKQNIRSSYGDTDVWSFIHSTINDVLSKELEHLRVTHQGVLYEVFRITDYVMGTDTFEEKMKFCRRVFELEDDRVNDYSNETAEKSEIRITTYLIVHLATVLLCANGGYDSYALEIQKSCLSSVALKVREKIRNGVARILEENEGLMGNQLQRFMKTYGQDGRWISQDIDEMRDTTKKKDAPSAEGTGAKSGAPVFNGPVTYINENHAPFLSGVQNVTPSHLTALQGMMASQTGKPLQALPSMIEESSEKVQENPQTDAPELPTSPLEAVLFNEALDMPKIKRALYSLVADMRQRNELKIVHWYIVWSVFRQYSFITKKQSQTNFIQWVKAIFGWSWRTENFKGSAVPQGVRMPLDEWTIENLSAQRPQAVEYMNWREALMDAFLTDGGSGRKDCKSELCSRWFDTRLG